MEKNFQAGTSADIHPKSSCEAYGLLYVVEIKTRGFVKWLDDWTVRSSGDQHGIGARFY